MSETVPQDGAPPGTPMEAHDEYAHGHAHQYLDSDSQPQSEDRGSRELLPEGDGDGGHSTTDDDDGRKMSQDSLISASPRGSPLLRPSRRRGYQDSDSCPSVSPSPDPDSRLQTFDFSMIEVPDEGDGISAALQTEREFLDFMLSLPQVQKEGPGRPQQVQKEAGGQPPQEMSPPPRSEHRSPTRAPASVGGVVGTKVGLDHLDNLCRMMEQLGELREQNTRLQRRVHYLEELQTLQEMHRHLQETLEARRSGLGLGPIHLSDSDIHLDEDVEGGGGELSRHGSEDSLLLLGHRPQHKGKPRSASVVARSRSKSVGTDLLDGGSQPGPKTKVSGWKRVKEALKWERATLLPPAPTPATATSAHHPTSPQPTPSPQPTTQEDPFFRPPSSSSSSSVLTEVMTEEDVLNLYRRGFDHNQFLELPESPVRRHSSSEEERRVATLERDDRGRPHDKEKKGHRSAWGKVKSMISTRRDSVRKKSSSAGHRKSTTERPDVSAGVAVEVSAASDPEDYEVDYEGLVGEAVDPGGAVGLCLEGNDGEWETGGVWVGPREDESPASTSSLGARRAKPQLTITVPSSENLSLLQEAGDRARQPHRSPETRHRKCSPAQLDPRVFPSLPMTPPSPRRASNWTKVKKAFLTGQQQHQVKVEVQTAGSAGSGGSASLPPSPSKKTSFHFDAPLLGVESSILEDSDSAGASLELSPEDLSVPSISTATPSPQPHPTPSPQPPSTQHHHQQSGVQRNLADLQKSLSGEFNRRLQEWERLKSGGPGQGLHHPGLAGAPSSPSGSGASGSHPEDNLPYEFRKKLHEWEKMKEREKEKGKIDVPRGQEDVKTKKHGEDDLPADFKKKLTEWEIRKALVGKSQQNVEELQKNLGEEFNRKMAEWERIKASASQQGQVKPGHPQVKTSASAGNLGGKGSALAGQMHVKPSPSASQVAKAPLIPGQGPASPRLDRKGSGHKIKKSKAAKTDKVPVSKAESSHKARDKELQWLEKELHKVERETQRLEREKEKFLERAARLERMRQAMGRGPTEKKEIYIKTSTGEFRFEGISQTFTKKLYEWEERRGIRPESSTIALLDPNYVVPEKKVPEKPKSPEVGRLVSRRKSESSLAADLVTPPVHSHPSSLSLNEIEAEETGLQAENKAASEPTLAGTEPGTPKVAVLVQLEEVVEDGHHALHDPGNSYAPAEITRNIDSSGSEEDVTRRHRADDDEDVVTNLRRTDSARTQGSYRSLLRENMSLLDKLRQQEDMCRALEHQMGDIDSKMDNVADQHLRTLEKLHRQVSIIMKDPSSSHDGEEGDVDPAATSGDPEANQRLINQLRSRIADLEIRGEHLMDEKVQLERAFKLHKEQETEIAESLVQRIRELQDAGAEVNIQTVQCQTDDVSLPSEDSVVVLEEPPAEVFPEEQEPKEEATKRPEKKEKAVEEERREGRPREHRKAKKTPPKKLQKLHNLTGDLLFQAKCLEQALVTKHGLDRRSDPQQPRGHGHRQRSLRGRSSLRLAGDVGAPQRSHRNSSARTWSSIEAITSVESPQDSGIWEAGSGAGLESYGAPRSSRGPTASTTSIDPQDLLAMNAELSRMAKELRLEMMKMWSYRESTSPESVSSETIGPESLDEAKPVDDKLVAEAKEVFQSIALLPKDSTPPSPHSGRSPSSRSRRSPSTTSLSKRRGSAGQEERCGRRSTERERSRSASGTPVRRDSHRQRKRREEEDDEDDEDEEEEDEGQRKEKSDHKDADISVFLPSGATFGELLLRSKQHHDEDESTWEGPRRRSSDGLSTVTSGPSRSRSPSPSIASSAPSVEASPRIDEEEEESISLAGTWRTTTTSTTRSGDYVLSSSFEWEEENPEERRRPRGRWKAVVEEEEEEEDEKEDRETPKPQVWTEAPEDTRRSFETEVTVAAPRHGRRDLKTRRISDTQVEYESFGQNNRDECFANTFSRTVYDDEALAAGRLSRNPSVRRANSRDADESHWRRPRTLPSVVLDDLPHSDRSPDVFVPTKRTIFTMQGSTRNPDQARATPTFVDSQEEDVAVPWRRSRSQPDTPTESNGHRSREDSKESSATPTQEDVAKPQVKEDRNETKPAEKAKDKQRAKKSANAVPDVTVNGEKEAKIDEKKKEKTEDNTEAQLRGGETVSEAVTSEEVDSEMDVIAAESLDVVPALRDGRSPRSPHSLTPSPRPSGSPIASPHLHAPTPISPPIESKKKVLEAANEGVPTVRSIIQKFNKRITENQELLGSPFRSPPMSPPWQSPRSQRKILAGLASCSKQEDTYSSTGDIIGSQSELPRPMIYSPPSGVLKSLSTSVIMTNAEISPKVTRSASGSFVQGSSLLIGASPKPTATSSPQHTPNTSVASAADVWGTSPSGSPAISPAPTDPDTSYDLDVSVDDSFHDRASASPQPDNKSPSARLRAMRIKKAKEDFLARGAAPLSAAEQRHSGSQDDLKMRHRSGTASTDDTWRDSDELFAGGTSPMPSPAPTEEASQDGGDAPDQLPRTSSKRRNIPKKESFRRQSAGCLLEESASQKLASQVVKSASSGVLSSGRGNSRYSIDSQSPLDRKASVDPSTGSGRSSRGIFRLFRRTKNRDKKDMPSVQRLCRQSLLVDFANGKGRTKSASPQPYSDLRSLPEMEGEEVQEMARSSRTLPRSGTGEVVSPAPSRSCPSSPVAQHRSRTANWIARGRQIFKSRSPSPSKKPR